MERMSRPALGSLLVVAALSLASLGMGLVTAPGEPETEPPPASDPASDAASARSTSGDEEEPRDPPAASPPPSTTSTGTSTTAAPPPGETVEAFVDRYRTALEVDDVEFLMARLHPVVLEAYGTDTCRAWVEREVLQLADYRLAGEVAGPESARVSTPQGHVEIPASYTAPVSFRYQGAAFQSEAGFALVDGSMRWLGVCR